MILLRSHRHRWEDNIEMVTQIKWGGVECMYLVRGREEWGAFIKAVMESYNL